MNTEQQKALHSASGNLLFELDEMLSGPEDDESPFSLPEDENDVKLFIRLMSNLREAMVNASQASDKTFDPWDNTNQPLTGGFNLGAEVLAHLEALYDNASLPDLNDDLTRKGWALMHKLRDAPDTETDDQLSRFAASLDRIESAFNRMLGNEEPFSKPT